MTAPRRRARGAPACCWQRRASPTRRWRSTCAAENTRHAIAGEPQCTVPGEQRRRIMADRQRGVTLCERLSEPPLLAASRTKGEVARGNCARSSRPAGDREACAQARAMATAICGAWTKRRSLHWPAGTGGVCSSSLSDEREPAAREFSPRSLQRRRNNGRSGGRLCTV